MDVAQLHRIAIAAKFLKVSRSTIKSAIERGELTAFTSACGLPMVRLADVEAWAAIERKRGPKPQKKQTAKKKSSRREK